MSLIKKKALHKQGELLLAQPMQSGRPAFISAASGLVRRGDYFFVIADDEMQLGIFLATPLQPGTALPLLAGELPLKPRARKRAKPDFEVLVELPPSRTRPYGALLILGSGSTSQRNRGVLLALTAQGQPEQLTPLTLDLTPLYAALDREFGTINIEGAVVQHEQLLLMQRGNKKHGVNAIVQLDLATLLHEIALHDVEAEKLVAERANTTIGATALRTIQTYALGSIDGVALGFTDATCLPDGQLLAIAVAEDTDDAYADGATLGSCLCRFDRDNRLLAITALDSATKIEGITVWQNAAANADTVLAFVTDADDVTIPAYLSTARLGDLS
jgi:hypothetical protein